MSAVPGTLGLPPEGIEAVLRAAMAAPSVRDRRPWSFRVTDRVIEIHSDPTRSLPAADPSGREQRMSCGAALFNLRLALEHAGVRPMVTLMPDGNQSTLLAVVREGGVITLGPQRAALYEAIESGRADPRSFTNELVPKAHQQALIRAAQGERSWLHIVADHSDRTWVQQLLMRAHAVQMADPDFRAELAERTDRDGESPSTGPPPHPQDEWMPREDSGGESLLVVLCSFHPGARADVQAGQALQRVLLTASCLGLTASFMSQVLEVAETRNELRTLVQGSIVPQMVLRLGFGS